MVFDESLHSSNGSSLICMDELLAFLFVSFKIIPGRKMWGTCGGIQSSLLSSVQFSGPWCTQTLHILGCCQGHFWAEAVYWWHLQWGHRCGSECGKPHKSPAGDTHDHPCRWWVRGSLPNSELHWGVGPHDCQSCVVSSFQMHWEVKYHNLHHIHHVHYSNQFRISFTNLTVFRKIHSFHYFDSLLNIRLS